MKTNSKRKSVLVWILCLLASNALAQNALAQNALAQNKVVIIPLMEETTVFRGTTRTGNITCSVYAGEPVGHWVVDINCSTPEMQGQDAEIQAGASSNPRFVIANGVVRDEVTGLSWLQDAHCTAAASWADALGYVIELNASGTMNGLDCGDTSTPGNTRLTKWRLPNIKELQTLFHFGFHSAPFLPDTVATGQWSEGDPFQGIQFDKAYWSSTSYGITLDDALRANFGDGSTDWTSKEALQYVWAVRDSN